MSLLVMLCLLFSLFLQYKNVISSSTHHSCHPDEAFSLLQFKEEICSKKPFKSLFGRGLEGQFCNYPKVKSWNRTSSNCCTWNGVTCDGITGHVIGLDLSSSRLVGLIHQNSSLFHLSHLRKLNLANNDFRSSTISPNIRLLSSLTYLNFSHSGLAGNIPLELTYLSKLVVLNLSNNKRLRLDPRHFQILLQNFTHIRVLSLSHVILEANLQANWSSSSLTHIDLGYTRIYGELPKYIFRFHRLQSLILVDNRNLRVFLPKTNNSNIPTLQVLDLSYTNVSSDGFYEPNPSFLLLKYLGLSCCGLSGFFPNSIANMSHIIQMDLAMNNFIGNFSSIILSSNHPKLEELDLSRNSFTGQISSLTGNLTELILLYLDNNLLSGPLLSDVSVFPKLKSIYLSHNAFNGTIPDWLFSIPTLTYLDLSNNCFTGEIKEFISKSLLLINLSSNKLHGSIEFTMFSHHSKLQYLKLSYNNFSIKIEEETDLSFPDLFCLGLSSCGLTKFPTFYKNSKKLSVLDLSNNKLDGQIPHWIPHNPLRYLNLSHNTLFGFGTLNTHQFINHLTFLDLSSNKFHEQLPLSVCSFKKLNILDLSRNKFTGAIPQCYGNSNIHLEVLNLAKNQLKGSISMNILKDKFLLNLNLNGNSLEGTLPESLANCKYMEVLDVGYNKISGTFPNFLENHTALQVLILKANRFFGSISSVRNDIFFHQLRVFDLSCNEFNGTLPPQLFKSFKAMTTLYKIEGEITYLGLVKGDRNESYGYTINFLAKGQQFESARIWATLVVIDLSCNHFTGNIPEIIGNLDSLIVLNLSRNNFTGNIPSTLRKLRFLESLDLSWNRIEGVIPWQLTDLTLLEILNLSQNSLVGRIPEGKQFNTFQNDSYYGNSGLCGFPLAINCREIDISSSPFQGVYRDDPNSDLLSEFTWNQVVIGYAFGTVFGFAIERLLFFFEKPNWLIRKWSIFDYSYLVRRKG